jgi:hypothetical protein
MADDNLAYDGSNRPQDRELTARERDILCRVLNDILIPIKLNYRRGEPIPANILDCVSIRVGESDFLNILDRIRTVINPREED